MTARPCRHCGRLPYDDEQNTVEALRQHCLDNDLTILPGDRVREDTAAILLGRSVNTLRNWRCQGAPLPVYRSGAGRGRLTYRLQDLAEHLDRNDELFP